MMRISNYIVESFFRESQGSENGHEISKVLVHSTRSGITCCLGAAPWAQLKGGNLRALKPRDLREMEVAKILVPDDEDELAAVVDENIKSNDSDSLYIPLQHQAQCQLGCVYCGQKHTNAKMTEDTKERLFKLVENKLASGKYKSLATAWFGSEPLLGKSMMLAMSRRFKDLCSKYQITYTSKIVTNGLLLMASDYSLLTDECNIRQVEVTLDGLADSHDKRRVFKDKKTGSFARIWANVLAWAARLDPAEHKLSIRCNVDQYNIADVEQLIYKLAKAQLQNKLTFYTAPVHNWGNEAATRSNRSLYAKAELDWLVQMQELGFQANILPRRTRSVCMATNNNSILVAPDGDVYGCTEVSLVPAYDDVNGRNRHALMNLRDEGDPFQIKSEKSKFTHWNNEVKAGQWPCSSCNVLPVCGGSCPKEWKEGAVPCPSFKDNFKDRLLLDYVSRKDASNSEGTTVKPLATEV